MWRHLWGLGLLAACAPAKPPPPAPQPVQTPVPVVAPAPPPAPPPAPTAPAPKPIQIVTAPSHPSLTSQAGVCPPEMTLVLDHVCIDKWEGSLVEVRKGGKLRRWSPHHQPKTHKRDLRARSKPGVLPQGHISGVHAERACQAAGKRLCSAREWATACRGPKRTLYPYGPKRRRAVCNDAGRKVHPVVALGRKLSIPKDRIWYEAMDHPMINQMKNTVRKTGERAGCTNAYGAFDMVGNLHEWIETPAGTFRGGFYMDTKINGEGCSYATTAHGFKYHDYSTGFRCCLDADSVD